MGRAPDSANSGVRILVVEDDPHVRNVLLQILDEEGWSTESADHGQLAVDQAREREPSLVILDISLPGLSGVEVAEHLHAMYDGIPILVVTAQDSAADYARRARAYGYLSKPFDLDRLLIAVATGLERGRHIEHRMEGNSQPSG